MKKILAIAFTLLTFATYAQQPSGTTSKTMTGSTLTNNATSYVTLSISKLYEVCSFQAVITKVSGTALGMVKLQYSNDGTNYVDVDATDTLHISNQTTNTKIFVITQNKAQYYRLYCLGYNTTQSLTCAGYFVGSGQRSDKVNKTMLSDYSLTSDTITNTGSGYVQYTLSNYYEKVSFQPVVTKLSGTAGGTVTLQVSNDGTNFVTISSSYASATTLSVTNQTTNTSILTVTSSPYKYYRLSYTGSGTMSCTLSGYLSASN